MHVGQMVFFGI